MINANKVLIDEDLLFEQVHQQTSLEGFDQLWQATEESLPENYKTPLEKLIEEQEEQILYLNDTLSILRSENFELREEMASMQGQFKAYERICQDYVSVIELNRALTKQLNSVMSLRQKEQNQIKALKTLLA